MGWVDNYSDSMKVMISYRSEAFIDEFRENHMSVLWPWAKFDYSKDGRRAETAFFRVEGRLVFAVPRLWCESLPIGMQGSGLPGLGRRRRPYGQLKLFARLLIAVIHGYPDYRVSLLNHHSSRSAAWAVRV